MYKEHFKLFLEANKDVQHYASHSHHYWPDVTRQATIDYWDDSAKFVDDKWAKIFGLKIPNVQRLIADILNLSHPEQIVFAPNTHEFVVRLLSCFKPGKKIRVLTTDSEFYSFDRQISRLIDDGQIEVVKVPTQNFDVFENRFKQHLQAEQWDLVFVSHVFFNSGMAIQDLVGLVETVTNPETIIAIDGYHGFMALPTDLKPIENRVFYISGSYKYAQGGEGCCFMTVPKATQLMPANTGWFAGFSGLANVGSKVVYSDDGYRFAGSTMDFTALYRLEASLSLFAKLDLSVAKIHRHVQVLQHNFLEDIKKLKQPHHLRYLNQKNLIVHDLNHHGHFLTFDVGSAENTKNLHDEFNKAGIRTDYRGTRWRFGFGLYQDAHIDFSKVNN